MPGTRVHSQCYLCASQSANRNSSQLRRDEAAGVLCDEWIAKPLLPVPLGHTQSYAVTIQRRTQASKPSSTRPLGQQALEKITPAPCFYGNGLRFPNPLDLLSVEQGIFKISFFPTLHNKVSRNMLTTCITKHSIKHELPLKTK